jgi:hypothetical protein
MLDALDGFMERCNRTNANFVLPGKVDNIKNEISRTRLAP